MAFRTRGVRREILTGIVAVSLLVPVELRAAPPPEPTPESAPEPPQPETPQVIESEVPPHAWRDSSYELPKSANQTRRAKWAKDPGFNMIIVGSALIPIGLPWMVVGARFLADDASALGLGLLGLSTGITVTGIVLVAVGAQRRKYSPRAPCARVSPLLDFDRRGGRVGVSFRF
jgi:hypothetical protein